MDAIGRELGEAESAEAAAWSEEGTIVVALLLGSSTGVRVDGVVNEDEGGSWTGGMVLDDAVVDSACCCCCGGGGGGAVVDAEGDGGAETMQAASGWRRRVPTTIALSSPSSP